MTTFAQLVENEIHRVRSKGCGCKGWHEAYGLMLEEVEEFWDEVKKKPSKRDKLNALHELVQIAAICERAAIDLALIDDYEKLKEAEAKRRNAITV